jgi:RNA polymerase sigma-70 factor (ECF subfamily)
LPPNGADVWDVEEGPARLDLDAQYRRLQPILLRHLQFSDARHAEDIAGEVWMEVTAALSRFSGDDRAFRAWVFTVARRRLIDSYRRGARHRLEPLGSEEVADESAAERPEDDAVGRLSARTTIARLHEVLPPDQAEVVLLRVVGGLGVNRVAAMTGKHPVNVRVLQHRGLRRLARDFGAQQRTA